MPCRSRGTPGWRAGVAPDVQLIDGRVGPGDVGRLVPLPVEAVVDDDGPRHVRSGVPVVPDGGVPAAHVSEDGIVVIQLAGDRPGVWVGEQLGGVEPMSSSGVPRTMDPEAVRRPGPQSREVAVPDMEGLLVQLVPGLGAVFVEDAQLDPISALGPQRDVGAALVRRDPERGPVARPATFDRRAPQRITEARSMVGSLGEAPEWGSVLSTGVSPVDGSQRDTQPVRRVGRH